METVAVSVAVVVPFALVKCLILFVVKGGAGEVVLHRADHKHRYIEISSVETDKFGVVFIDEVEKISNHLLLIFPAYGVYLIKLPEVVAEDCGDGYHLMKRYGQKTASAAIFLKLERFLRDMLIVSLQFELTADKLGIGDRLTVKYTDHVKPLDF
jgi:hypothetical protein